MRLIKNAARKTPCVSEVLAGFGVLPHHYRKAQCGQDILRILARFGFGHSSRKTEFGVVRGRTTVTQLRRAVRFGHYRRQDRTIAGYFVIVEGHALSLTPSGDYLADTDPRRSGDRRKVRAVYEIRSTGPVAQTLTRAVQVVLREERRQKPSPSY
jgi:hypothetical protein